MTTGPSLPRGVILSYALPAFVVSLPTIPLYIYLPAFYGIELGLGLAATGLLLLFARLFDTVTDPLVGWLSDRFGFKGKRRKPWIALGALVGGLGLFQLLNPPDSVDGSYLILWSIVLYAGWTMVSVPYTAWGAELSGDYNERTLITSWREALGLLGILFAGGVVAAIAGSGAREADAMGVLALTAILLGLLVFPILFYAVPDWPQRPRSCPLIAWPEFRRGIATLYANRPFCRLLLAWFMNGFANGIPAALFFVYLEFGLGAQQEQRAYLVLAYFLAAVAAIPLWRWLSLRHGKHRVWCVSMLMACAAFVLVPLIAEGALAFFLVVCLVTGMALGADLALPPAIQADVVDYDELKNGVGRAGLQFAFWSMSTKLALALSVGLALPALGILGFDPARPTEEGRTALLVIYALVPVVIKVTAVTIMWHFPLTAQRQVTIRRRLKRGRYGRGGNA